MRPALSVILLTTLIGAGQGLFIAVFAADVLARFGLLRDAPSSSFFACGALLAAALATLGLVASFFHLGRPERAWRAAAQWRTSWLSREVIVLPLFIAGLLVYAATRAWQLPGAYAAGTATLAFCAALFVCTAMIYACMRFLQEWATSLTLVNFTVLGCASGTAIASALAASWASTLASDFALAAMALTATGFLTRSASLARNARLRPTSTPQSAIGIKHPRIVQKAQGFIGGSFNTREFFHGATPAKMRAIRLGFLWSAFVMPIVLMGAGLATGATALLMLAALVQFLGMLGERWYFFAQANHPQNLYYQAMS